MTSSEEILWNYLDKCGIEFREKKSKLITTYGSRNCGWADNLDYCEVGTKQNFIENLAHPIVFQFNPTIAQDMHSTAFQGYIRTSNNAHENFELACNQITTLFGQGNDASSSNSKGRIWRFGKAEITIICFPPELNTNSPNTRHQAIPGSATECSLYIETAYCPPPTDGEVEILENTFPTKEDMNLSINHARFSINRTTRKLSKELPHLENGRFRLDASKKYLLRIIDSQHFDILPSDWIKGVTYESIKPAKGGGGIYLHVIYRSPAQRKTITPLSTTISRHRLIDSSSIVLVSTSYEEGAYLDVAKQLSEDLDVPLSQIDDYDC